MVNPDSGSVNRRRLLGGVVAGLLAAIGSLVGVLAGGAVLSPGLAARRRSWTDAGPLANVTDARPEEVALVVEREDGYRVVRDREVVYLVRDGGRVRAFSATCTHLGCRVAWHDAEREFRCPCHGGRFDMRGAVTGGPPPRGLTELPARAEGPRVLVELA
jgi:Rieske Fe-S protein